LKYYLYIIIIIVVFSPLVCRGANVTFEIAPIQSGESWQVLKYLAFMAPPGVDITIDKDFAVAEVPSDETVFLVKDVPVGDWCFGVVGLYSDGKYSPLSNIECLDIQDFFSEHKLNFI